MRHITAVLDRVPQTVKIARFSEDIGPPSYPYVASVRFCSEYGLSTTSERSEQAQMIGVHEGQ